MGIDLEGGLFSAANLVFLAMAFYVVGFVFKDQIVLRLLILGGTAIYIAYYYLAPDEPLWGAITASVLIGIANLIGFGRLMYDRLEFGMSTEMREIYHQLRTLQPGEFRRLMRHGSIQHNEADLHLTLENEVPTHLYFVIEGEPHATKGDTSFSVPIKRFVGELSFVLHSDASATVVLPAGGKFVSWERGELERLLAKDHGLSRGMEALLSHDMAQKVFTSIQVVDWHDTENKGLITVGAAHRR